MRLRETPVHPMASSTQTQAKILEEIPKTHLATSRIQIHVKMREILKILKISPRILKINLRIQRGNPMTQPITPMAPAVRHKQRQPTQLQLC